ARMDQMLSARDDLTVPSLGDADPGMRQLVDRASVTARSLVSRASPTLERAGSSFWAYRSPEDATDGDRSIAVLTAFFDAEDNALIASFAQRRRLPVPYGMKPAPTREWVHAMRADDRQLFQGWLRQYRLARLSFGRAQMRDEAVMSTLNGDIDEKS